MITAAEIFEEVSKFFDCPVSQIKSKLKSYRETDARQAAIYLIKTQTVLKNEEIAAMFGYRNKRTICHVKVAAESKMQADKEYKQKVLKVVNSITKLKLNNVI